MAESFVLEAQPRTVTGKKVSQLRAQGLVPAVIYGSKTEPMAVQIPGRALKATLLKAGGTHLIDVSVNGNTLSVLARDVQRDVIRGDILHVDFLAVDVNATVTTVVPLHFVGESPAVASRLAMLSHGINSIEIEALPRDLIDAIEVDISGLKEIGDSIHVRDLKVSDKVKLLADEDELVVRVIAIPQVVEEEEAAEEEAGAAEPELIRREREDEEDEE